MIHEFSQFNDPIQLHCFVFYTFSPTDYHSCYRHRRLFLHPTLLKFPRQLDDLFAQDDQFDGRLFEPIEHLQAPLLVEIGLDGRCSLVVIVQTDQTPSKKLPPLCMQIVCKEKEKESRNKS
jgi:hypothetical protein